MDMQLRELRRNAGYATQEALAVEVGTSRDAVAQWEIGAAYPRAPLLPKLAAILNTPEGNIIAAIAASKRDSA